MVTPNVEFC